MANVKISALPAASLPLSGTEAIPLVQAGVTSQAPASAFGGGGGSSTAGSQLAIYQRSLSSQSLPNATDTNLQFDHKVIDNGVPALWIVGALPADTLVCPVSGYYTLQVWTSIDAHASGIRFLEAVINGSNDDTFGQIQIAGAGATVPDDFTALGFSFTGHLSVGDTLSIDVFQDSGATLNVNGALSIYRIF